MPTWYFAWRMLCRRPVVRLDCDMRILPKDVLFPTIDEFQCAFHGAAEKVSELPQLSLDQLLQMQLPGHFGGMFLPSPSLIKL
jgi:hypothetical protein